MDTHIKSDSLRKMEGEKYAEYTAEVCDIIRNIYLVFVSGS